MKGKRFSSEQIISILKESDAGIKPADLCRKHGISEGTYYNWKAKYGDMTVSDAIIRDRFFLSLWRYESCERSVPARR